jgi:hypothetical protein
MSRFLFTNGLIFGGRSPDLLADHDVVVEDGIIAQISEVEAAAVDLGRICSAFCSTGAALQARQLAAGRLIVSSRAASVVATPGAQLSYLFGRSTTRPGLVKHICARSACRVAVKASSSAFEPSEASAPWSLVLCEGAFASDARTRTQ